MADQVQRQFGERVAIHLRNQIRREQSVDRILRDRGGRRTAQTRERGPIELDHDLAGITR